jgi:hypothetical protein
MNTKDGGIFLKEKWKYHRNQSHSSKLKYIGTEHDIKPFFLPNDSFTLSNAEPNNIQLMKCTYSNGLTLST